MVLRSCPYHGMDGDHPDEAGWCEEDTPWSCMFYEPFKYFCQCLSKAREEKKLYNCAKVLCGSYVVGTNEFGRMITSGYKIIEGNVRILKRKSFFIRDQECDCDARIDVYLIFPALEKVIIQITNSHGDRDITLIKSHNNRSKMYRMKL